MNYVISMYIKLYTHDKIKVVPVFNSLSTMP